MEKKNGDSCEQNKYTEIINTEHEKEESKEKNNLPCIRWYEEKMTLDTLPEAYEWVSSDAFNRYGFNSPQLAA